MADDADDLASLKLLPENIFVLSPEDYDKFVAEVMNPGEPTEAAKRGAARLRELFARRAPWDK